MAPGTRPSPPTKARAQIADDVAVEVLQQQRVVLVGIHHQLHAGVVDDVLAVEDLGKPLGHLARAAQKQPVGELHDVGLVDGVNLLAAVLARVLEGELGDARRALFGDHLDALDHAGNDFVLQADVLALGVFADDDQVHAGPIRSRPGRFLMGRKLAKRSNFLRSVTLMLLKPPPMGVVTGPLRATLLRSMDS